jgi:hypothetical protein
VASLSRRLQKLEVGSIRGKVVRQREAQGDTYSEWVHSCRVTRAESTPEDALMARAAIRQLHQDGHLSEMSAEETVEAIAISPQGAISPNIARLELMRFIFNSELATDHMELPDEWRETFEAGGELRRRFAAMLPATVALWVAERTARQKEGATEEEVKQLDDTFREPHGITQALEERGIGPDAGEITEAEKGWRIAEHVHDVLASSWGFQMYKHANRLEY